MFKIKKMKDGNRKAGNLFQKLDKLRNEGDMNYIEELGKKAKAASRELLKIGTKKKTNY